MPDESDTDIDAKGPCQKDDGGNNSIAREVTSIDHKADLTEVDKQLKDRDREELDKVEDLMEDVDNKDPLELLVNITEEQKKMSVVRTLNKYGEVVFLT